MTIIAPGASVSRFDQDQLRPDGSFFADYRTGTISPFTGQTPVFTRSGTDTIETQLNTYTIGSNQPKLDFEYGELSYVPVGSTLQYDFNARAIFPTRIYARVIRTSSTSGVICRIGSASGNNATLTLEQNSTRYRLMYYDASGTLESVQVIASMPLNEPIDLIATADLSGTNEITTTISWRTTGNYTFLGTLGSVPSVQSWSDSKLHVGSLNGSSEPGSAISALLIDYSPGLQRPWGWA